MTTRIGDTHMRGVNMGPPVTGFRFYTGFNDIPVPDERANKIEAERQLVKITGAVTFTAQYTPGPAKLISVIDGVEHWETPDGFRYPVFKNRFIS